MKRIFLTFAMICLTLGAWAQDTYYAELLSRNNYYGTARSVALGNAMTALGGDLGSVGINPAGSAVNSFGQFTVTPALLISSSGSSWSADGGNSFSSPFVNSQTKFNVPNVGVTLQLHTGNYTGLKYITMGFLANSTNTFLKDSQAAGTSTNGSFLGNLAAAAYGNTAGAMARDLYTAYQANQIGEFGTAGSLRYAGANQMVDPSDRYCYVPGALDQVARNYTYGTKTDIILNLGFNVDDEFYFGFNLGMPYIKYRRHDDFYESAQNSLAFPVNFVDEDGMHLGTEGEPTTYYKSSDNSYALNTETSGIYGKFGLIWLPTKGLRLGAAIQTPALLNIREQWQYTAATSYENSSFNGDWNSDIGSYEYEMRTPYVIDAGVAYTFGGLGLVSLDYELTDYSVMRYRDINSGFYSISWKETNMCNSLFCGVSHSVRAGLEFKPTPALSLRAGYSIITDPERYASDSSGNKITPENWGGPNQILRDFRYFKNNTQAYSVGLGYSSAGSFFADAAVRLTSYPVTHFNSYYYGDYQAVDKDNRPVDAWAPVIKSDRKIVDVLLTLGWRF